MSEPAPSGGIDDRKVEHAFERIRDSLNLSMQLDIGHLEALIERFRIELMLARPSRERRAVYRASIDLLEAELHRRYEAEGHHPDSMRAHVVDYFRRLVAGFQHDDD
jgi:hypothetical protein